MGNFFMMEFDLKAFRESRGYKKQSAFAKLIGYNQTMVSQVETGQKKISDKLLLRIEAAFQINLDHYKRYERNKMGLYLEAIISDPLLDVSPLLEAKDASENVTATSEALNTPMSFAACTPELILARENNQLLKELLSCLQELLRRVPAKNNLLIF
jgi:transcriptional regulator with XRE-family HTH domain